MSIEVIQRFNNGNGGVSIIIKQETGRFGMVGAEEEEEEEISAFVEAPKAVELALDILKVVNLPEGGWPTKFVGYLNRNAS